MIYLVSIFKLESSPHFSIQVLTNKTISTIKIKKPFNYISRAATVLGIMGTPLFAQAQFSFGNFDATFDQRNFEIGPPAFSSQEVRILTKEECKAEFVSTELAKLADRQELAESFARDMELQANGSNRLSMIHWTPTGVTQNPSLAECNSSNIEDIFLNNAGSTEKQAVALRGFFKRCDKDLRSNAPIGPIALLKIELTSYNLCDHPQMRKVVIRIPNGEVIRGFLALKQGNEKRPLVIAKCGVLCNSGDPSMRWLLMHLYDEGPFNVLALANSSGADFVRDNAYFVPGGYQEGQQIIQVAKLMRQSDLGSKTSSIHFVGISLGSHGGLFASYLNQFLSTEKNTTDSGGTSGTKLITSSLNICPVVDLQQAIESLFTSPIKGPLVRKILDRNIEKVVKTRPELRSLFPWENLQNWQLPAQIGIQAAEFYQNKSILPVLPPFREGEIQSARDFWAKNQFLEIAKIPMQTPTFIIAGADDWIVNTDKNSVLVEKVIKKTRKNFPHETTQLDAVVLESGNHCAFSQIYGWRTASALFRSFILANSPELMSKRRISTVAFATEQDSRGLRKFSEYSQRSAVEFSFQKDSNYLHVKSTMFKSGSGECIGSPHGAGPFCFRTFEYSLPFESLNPRPDWAIAPSSESEAEGRTRWANVHMKLLGSLGTPVEGTKNPGTQLNWVDYQ